jgi:hypothetical protein
MARRSKRFIKSAIKRPGALTRAKKKGESTGAAARRLKKGGTTLQKRQANFYLNVLAPANKKRKGTGSKKSSPTHRVRAHHRTLSSGRKVRVKSHRKRRRK